MTNEKGAKVGSAGISKTQYAQQTHKLITLIKELRGVGAQADIDLPRIAVIGNQSAGKSSLVEAISGITVPRAKGTCTRCPMECRLQSSSKPWNCQIFLRIETDEMGQRLQDIREVKFGPPLTDKAKLEDMLRRAQLAILNPSVNYQSFEDLDLNSVTPDQPPVGNTRPLQFSSNVIALDISGQDLADLSFIDLPGIISNVADGQDRKNIQLVQDLVKEHIQGNSLILLTLTMKDDVENQSAAFHAKEVDPKGLRTIGVLTKADTIESGEEEMWLDIIQGQRHALKHGYYVTKQSSPEELAKKTSFEESRKHEQEFFATTEPWKSSDRQVKSRIGIPKLTAELSKLLSQLILQTLPKLRADAQQALTATQKELELLPPPLPENPVLELLNLITAFSAETRQWIYGSEGKEGLIQIYKDASAELKKNIRRTTPDYRPFESAKAELKRSNERPQHGVHNSQLDTDGVVSSPTMFLLDIRAHVAKARSRELPYNVPFSAKRSLITDSFTTWNEHAMTFFEIVCHAAHDQLNKVVDDHFRRFTMSPLKDNVKTVVEKQVDHFGKVTKERITWFLKLEDPPFTQNYHYLSSLREEILSKYKAARNGQKLQIGDHSATRALQALMDCGISGLCSDDLYKLVDADKYEEELIVMAEVSAYCRVAYKRVIDNLPRIVDHDFLHALGENIQAALLNEFGIGSEDAAERAKIYMVEDPSDVAKRTELKAKEQRLNEVLTKLRLFHFGL